MRWCLLAVTVVSRTCKIIENGLDVSERGENLLQVVY